MSEIDPHSDSRIIAIAKRLRGLPISSEWRTIGWVKPPNDRDGFLYHTIAVYVPLEMTHTYLFSRWSDFWDWVHEPGMDLELAGDTVPDEGDQERYPWIGAVYRGFSFGVKKVEVRPESQLEGL